LPVEETLLAVEETVLAVEETVLSVEEGVHEFRDLPSSIMWQDI
jgi:hypothetical protein